MGFSEFIGNATAVRHLREAIAAKRVPPALIVAGPAGAGKYTLAIMLAQALNCLEPIETNGLVDFCGVCDSCIRIAQSRDLETRFAEAVAAREELRETDKKETRILIQTHPDVVILPPDPPQLLIKLGQIRAIVSSIYRMPAEGRSKIYILTSTALMKEAANSLLKVLEEPPPHAHILILAENPGELLPTLRSRAQTIYLGALPSAEIDAVLAQHRPEWKPTHRTLVGRLAEGAIGRALSFDLAAYTASRQDALLLLRTALNEPDFSSLFKVTETYRAGADGQQRTSALLRALYSLLEDMLLVHAGAAGMIRNVDIATDIVRLVGESSFDWIERASRAAGQAESGMRRNLLRSLALDSLSMQLIRQ